MLQEERFNNIITKIKDSKQLTFKEIAELNGVSIDTARRDIETLSEYNVVKKIRGGAEWRDEALERLGYNMRNTINIREKVEISSLMPKVIQDGQTIAIGSGSTTVQIAKALERDFERLTVITNDLDVVEMISKKKHFTTILLGGFLDLDENCTYGEECERELKKFNVDVSILAVNSISLEKGVTDFRLNQIGIMKGLIEIADKVVIAADHNKFEQKPACVSLCNLNEIDTIVSDTNLCEEKIKKLREMGIEVIVS